MDRNAFFMVVLLPVFNLPIGAARTEKPNCRATDLQTFFWEKAENASGYGGYA
jgi:hypothetical protein